VLEEIEKEKVASVPDRTLNLTPAPRPVIRYREGATQLEDRTLAGLDRCVRSSVAAGTRREERE
jgi:hypothetical protein